MILAAVCLFVSVADEQHHALANSTCTSKMNVRPTCATALQTRWTPRFFDRASSGKASHFGLLFERAVYPARQFLLRNHFFRVELSSRDGWHKECCWLLATVSTGPVKVFAGPRTGRGRRPRQQAECAIRRRSGRQRKMNRLFALTALSLFLGF